MNLSGIIPPMVTPLAGRNTLDTAAIERLVEHILSGGARGLFILGTTGEGPALSYPLRRAVVQKVCAQVRERVPVLVCITDNAYEESLGLARYAADVGASAVVAAPPFYWALQRPDLEHYFLQLASDSPLPVFLYNMPSLTKIAIPVETIARAMTHENVVGMKDSSGSLNYLHQVLRLRKDRPDWPVLVGDEETLVYAMHAGANGGVNGGANVFPQLYSGLFNAIAAQDAQSINRLQALIVRMGDLYRLGRGSISIISGIKQALEELGLCAARCSEPYLPLDAIQIAGVKALVEEIHAALP